jgi:hypothetical protein
MNYLPIPLVVFFLMLVKLAWYVGVIVLLFLIWKKVQHLPGK